MKTTIDNNLRVFHIVNSTGKQWFCNLQDIPVIIKENELRADYYKIWEFWNNKPRRIGKTALNAMFEANRIDFKL